MAKLYLPHCTLCSFSVYQWYLIGTRVYCYGVLLPLITIQASSLIEALLMCLFVRLGVRYIKSLL